jgi:hypothetical protein
VSCHQQTDCRGGLFFGATSVAREDQAPPPPPPRGGIS